MHCMYMRAHAPLHIAGTPNKRAQFALVLIEAAESVVLVGLGCRVAAGPIPPWLMCLFFKLGVLFVAVPRMRALLFEVYIHI